jgi:hypothetical protein
MSRSRHACLAAGLPKIVAKGFLGERFAAQAADESKVTARPSVKRPSQNWEDRQRYLNCVTAFFRLQRGNATSTPASNRFDRNATDRVRRCLPNREAIMSKAIVFLTAVIFGLSSPALAAGKGGGGGGGQNTTSHATTQQANKPQVSNVIKTKHDTVKNSISNIR